MVEQIICWDHTHTIRLFICQILVPTGWPASVSLRSVSHSEPRTGLRVGSGQVGDATSDRSGIAPTRRRHQQILAVCRRQLLVVCRPVPFVRQFRRPEARPVCTAFFELKLRKLELGFNFLIVLVFCAHFKWFLDLVGASDTIHAIPLVFSHLSDFKLKDFRVKCTGIRADKTLSQIGGFRSPTDQWKPFT